MRSRKRSSCASGSGYVPSYSIGFCVASTRNGGPSRRVSPSVVTCRSCIASSSAACVFGGARLISSASRRLAKIGPGRNSKSASRWLKIDEPVTSDGIRSGVNWMREKSSEVDLRERARHQRLRQPGVVLDQHVPVGEQPEQQQLERVALADDGPLDLVEDAVGQLADLGQLHRVSHPLKVGDERAQFRLADALREAVVGRGRSGAAGPTSGRASPGPAFLPLRSSRVWAISRRCGSSR